jgi:hypothetical protein
MLTGNCSTHQSHKRNYFIEFHVVFLFKNIHRFGIVIDVLSELKTLRQENTELKSFLQKNSVTIESKDIEIGRLEMELRLLRQKLYGPKSERIVLDDFQEQTQLFNEAEAIVEKATEFRPPAITQFRPPRVS